MRWCLGFRVCGLRNDGSRNLVPQTLNSEPWLRIGFRMMASRYKQKTNVQKANRYKTNKNVRKASRHKKHTCGQQTATTKTSVHQANRYKTNKNVRKASRHKKQTCGQQTVTKNKRAESKPVPKNKRAESKPARKANPKLFLSFIAWETRFVLQLYMLA